MTTLVVTHASGFLGCFTQDDDGTMRQRALIDTGDEPPTAVDLANIGNRLASDYGWTLTPVVEAPKRTKAKALPAADEPVKRKRKKELAPRNYDNHSDPPVTERPAMVKAYLADHPYSTTKEIITGLGMEPTQARCGRWHHCFAAMWKANEIARRIRKDRLQEYFLPDWLPDEAG